MVQLDMKAGDDGVMRPIGLDKECASLYDAINSIEFIETVEIGSRAWTSCRSDRRIR